MSTSTEIQDLIASARAKATIRYDDELCAKAASLGEDAVPALAALLEESRPADPEEESVTCLTAIELLRATGSARAGEVLLGVLATVPPDAVILRGELALALQEVAEPGQVLAALGEVRGSGEAQIDLREELGGLLAKLEPKSDPAYEALVGLLEENPAYFGRCLAEYGDPRAIDPLLRAFDAAPFEEEPSATANLTLLDLADSIEALGGELDPERRARAEAGQAVCARWAEGFAWGERFDAGDEAGFGLFLAQALTLFAQAPEGEALTSPQAEWVAHTFRVAFDESNVSPCDVNPARLERVLLKDVPWGTDCEPKDVPELVSQLEAFWLFASRVFGVGNLAGYQRVLEKARRRLPALLDDPTTWSPDKLFAIRGREAGFDMETTEGWRAYEEVLTQANSAKDAAAAERDAKAQARKEKAKEKKRKQQKKSRKRNR